MSQGASVLSHGLVGVQRKQLLHFRCGDHSVHGDAPTINTNCLSTRSCSCLWQELCGDEHEHWFHSKLTNKCTHQKYKDRAQKDTLSNNKLDIDLIHVTTHVTSQHGYREDHLDLFLN